MGICCRDSQFQASSVMFSLAEGKGQKRHIYIYIFKRLYTYRIETELNTYMSCPPEVEPDKVITPSAQYQRQDLEACSKHEQETHRCHRSSSRLQEGFCSASNYVRLPSQIGAGTATRKMMESLSTSGSRMSSWPGLAWLQTRLGGCTRRPCHKLRHLRI